MESVSALEQGKDLLSTWVLQQAVPETHRLDVWVSPENLKLCVSALMDNQWGYLMGITGMDNAAQVNENGIETQEGMIEGIYHFANGAAILSIRVKVPYSAAQIPSICDIIPSATIYEREFIELLGVDLVDTPDTTHLVLPDGWPEDVYPLRKSFSSLPSMQSESKEV